MPDAARDLAVLTCYQVVVCAIAYTAVYTLESSAPDCPKRWRR